MYYKRTLYLALSVAALASLYVLVAGLSIWIKWPTPANTKPELVFGEEVMLGTVYEALDFHLGGTPTKSDIERILPQQGRSFRTIAYNLTFGASLEPRKEGEPFFVVYVIPDHVELRDDLYPWANRAVWEIWAYFGPSENLYSFTPKRVSFKQSHVQKALLKDNPENLEELGTIVVKD